MRKSGLKESRWLLLASRVRRRRKKRSNRSTIRSIT